MSKYRSLKSFIIQSQVLKLYRDFLKQVPIHYDDYEKGSFRKEVRVQFEVNRNADEKHAWLLLGDGMKQLNQLKSLTYHG